MPAEKAAYQGGVDLLRAQGAATNALLDQGRGDRSGELNNTRFSSGIDRCHGHRPQAPSRCHIDDQACTTPASQLRAEQHSAGQGSCVTAAPAGVNLSLYVHGSIRDARQCQLV